MMVQGISPFLIWAINVAYVTDTNTATETAKAEWVALRFLAFQTLCKGRVDFWEEKLVVWVSSWSENSWRHPRRTDSLREPRPKTGCSPIPGIWLQPVFIIRMVQI